MPNRANSTKRPLLAALACLTLCACSLSSRAAKANPPRTSAKPRAQLSLTYLGVAGWQIDDGRHVVLTDPYFSRPSAETIEEGPLVADETAIAARAPRKADLIVVGHSHFDHVLDVPAVARHTGAEVLGTEATAQFARASGLPADKIIPVKGGEDYAFDGFSVRVIPSLHSALDDKHTFGGASRLDPQLRPPLRAEEFVEGGTLAYLVRMGGVEVLVLSTANFIERELEGLHPDVAIVATGLRGEVHDYTCRLMRVLHRPPLVLANHFDAWRKPYRVVTPEQHEPETRADMQRFQQEVQACSPHTRVVVPTHGLTISVP